MLQPGFIKADGITPEQTEFTGISEADTHSWAGADGERAGAQQARAQGDDQHRDDREPGPGGI